MDISQSPRQAGGNGIGKANELIRTAPKLQVWPNCGDTGHNIIVFCLFVCFLNNCFYWEIWWEVTAVKCSGLEVMLEGCPWCTQPCREDVCRLDVILAGTRAQQRALAECSRMQRPSLGYGLITNFGMEWSRCLKSVVTRCISFISLPTCPLWLS